MHLHETLLDRFRTVRAHTESLAAPLSAEDQTVQSMPDVSPAKWHRAHVTWFFETFVLERFAPDHRPYQAEFRELFNSYYEGVGPQFTRAMRGLITRPGAEEVGKYRAHVDAAIAVLLERGAVPDEALALIELGCHHEQQHQELLLMDAKHVLSINPLRPVYDPACALDGDPSAPAAPGLGWHEVAPDGPVEIGHAGGDTFHFDNEGPRHRVWLEPYAVADRLVTAGEWRAFIDDGGYRRPELWLSDGWHNVQREGWTAPLYWAPAAPGEWLVHTLAGTRPVADGEPVTHVSHYEADAYARWVGAQTDDVVRLPTEFEWEHAATVDPGRGRLHGLADTAWQWTSSAYLPYPGFVPAAGAVGEYNGKFMSGQMVLRGASSFTPAGHARPTYRNFFPARCRWMRSGVRLAKDLPR
ncbi:MAG: ergothioneine biosynthesis protein EgtB [Acidimicrobiales bacterium]